MIWCGRVHMNLGLGFGVAWCTKVVCTRLGRRTPTRGGSAWEALRWLEGDDELPLHYSLAATAGVGLCFCRRTTEHGVPSYIVSSFPSPRRTMAPMVMRRPPSDSSWMTKGMSRIETTGPALAEISAGIQVSAERLAVLMAYV
ncbi:hypothetical protein V6N13_063771 [Hibiscus sabdariffa]